MKLFLSLPWLLVGMLAAGCIHHRPAPVKFAAPTGVNSSKIAPEPIVTPDNSLAGKVAAYNSVGRFMVLSFPIGRMPSMDQNLFLYRNGLKVGEIKITGPQRDNNTVADLISGDAQVGDEVRDQ